LLTTQKLVLVLSGYVDLVTTMRNLVPGPEGAHHANHHHEGLSFSGNSISVQSKHGNRFIQIPSNVTDFTNDDNSSLILVSVHNSKDIVSTYDIKGVVENVSNKTLIGVWVEATLYDGKMNAIVVRQSPATITGSTDSNIEPGQSKPFDIPFFKPDLNGQATPMFFKLGFRWL
jgi:pectate lyase